MKKVLYLLPSNKFSGAENVVCTIIENNKKYDMYYCCPKGEICDVLKEKRIKYIPIEKFRPSCLLKICNEYGIDIIHAHDYKASVIAGVSGFKGKIISHLHCNYPFAKKWNLFTILYNMISKKFYKVAVVSNSVLDEAAFKKGIEKKTFVITNVVDYDMINLKGKEDYDKNYDLLFIGRLCEAKNPFLFVDVVKEIRKKLPFIHAVMIGDGIMKDSLMKKIKEYDLQKNIDMTGFEKNPFKIISKSKIALMPSFFEGFGFTAVESMCLGKPVINSGAGGLATIFGNNKEFICKDLEEYTDLCLKLLSDDKLWKQYSSKCLSIVKPYTDVVSWENEIYSLYE